MKLGIKEKVAVVLAASKGMGRASAEALAEEGCKLAICARTKRDIMLAAEQIGTKHGVEVYADAIDVEKRDQMRKFLAAVQKKYGGIHILVTNCGGPPHGKPLEFDDDEWDGAARSTLMAPINWMRAVAPLMVVQQWGRIVNIVSLAVKQPIDGLVLSNSMRMGVIGFAKTLAKELAPFRVTVNNLLPGLIHTDRLANLAQARAKDAKSTPEEMLKRMAAEIPMGRLGSPDEFAAMVAFLASEKASYVTGTSIQIDGGLYKGMV